MNNNIKGSQICKSFGEGSEKRKVLDSLSLEIKQGEFVAIMGPSGCGKSTLLFSLSGLDNIDSGEILFNDKDLKNITEKAEILMKKMNISDLRDRDIFTEIHREGCTVFLVTHDVKVAAHTERVLFMQDGKFVEELSIPLDDGRNREDRIITIRAHMQMLGL